LEGISGDSAPEEIAEDESTTGDAGIAEAEGNGLEESDDRAELAAVLSFEHPAINTRHSVMANAAVVFFQNDTPFQRHPTSDYTSVKAKIQPNGQTTWKI
jgi:hypothetical protein